jgi:hypothetical protein
MGLPANIATFTPLIPSWREYAPASPVTKPARVSREPLRIHAMWFLERRNGGDVRRSVH